MPTVTLIKAMMPMEILSTPKTDLKKRMTLKKRIAMGLKANQTKMRNQ